MHTGVIVGKRKNNYIIYCRVGFVVMVVYAVFVELLFLYFQIGRWKRENVDAPEVGQWIQFKSKFVIHWELVKNHKRPCFCRQIEPKKNVVDSNSFREVPPLYITKVEDGNVQVLQFFYIFVKFWQSTLYKFCGVYISLFLQIQLTVPCHVKGGKLFTEFVRDTNGRDFFCFI